uniref:Ig-like domain-containing protein n=1 Tax=Esox lucius TaxID=8010 RepID=A0A3P8ZYU6_ESOLU
MQYSLIKAKVSFTDWPLCAKLDTLEYIDPSADDMDGVKMFGLDGEEKWYPTAEFIKQKVVQPNPSFADPFTYTGGQPTAMLRKPGCRYKSLQEPRRENRSDRKVWELINTLISPHSSIYPRDDVVLGVENTLICHVTGFIPPPVRVRWTRNNQTVTEGVHMSTPYPNQDFSHKQDIYSCTVVHQGLSEPQTRIWKPKVTQPSVDPAVFCGVGLTVGLLGVATGTFFLIKGNERLRLQLQSIMVKSV